MGPRSIRLGAYVFATLLFLGSMYCALWVASSFSMAFAYCEAGFSLFSEIPRCRQPHIAAILFVVLLALSVFCLYLGRRASKNLVASERR